MISDEAVEAAARLLYNDWDDDATFLKEVRSALEAAAPYMLADAWEEGERAGLMNHAAEEYPEVKDIPNPYRSQA